MSHFYGSLCNNDTIEEDDVDDAYDYHEAKAIFLKADWLKHVVTVSASASLWKSEQVSQLFVQLRQ